MTSQHDKAKRWRPRFSVRTLVIVVTLVCIILALWLGTNRQGRHDVDLATGQDREVVDSRAVLPLVVETVEIDTTSLNDRLRESADAARLRTSDNTIVVLLGAIQVPRHRRYYFWFFGYVAKLPFEQEL